MTYDHALPVQSYACVLVLANVGDTGCRISLQLSLTLAQQELDSVEVLFIHVQALSKLPPGESFEIWSCGGWLCSSCAEAASVECKDISLKA